MTAVPVPEPALPQWLVDAVMGLVKTAFEAGKAEGLAVEPSAAPVRDVHTRAEAADILRVSRTTVDKLIKSGALESFMVGDRRLVSDVALRAYIEATK